MFKRLLIWRAKQIIMQSPSKMSILGTDIFFGRYHVYKDVFKDEWVIRRNVRND